MARTKWRLSNELRRDALVGKTGKEKKVYLCEIGLVLWLEEYSWL